jgi:hypothetical protein
MNSIQRVEDRILIMLHNGTLVPPRNSEVLVFDRSWNLVDRTAVDGMSCHDILPLDDGSLLYCGSDDGELIGSNGLKIKLSPYMTRGLARNDRHLIVGTSRLAERHARELVQGSVIFLGHDYQPVCEVQLPGAPTCIISV